ncbi:MAG: hypothetical protein HOB84_04620 [Candidatus Marinimicrobia bacterium]|jgi:hypothetical protein|nr:hypothetical protein [Candidatus Neomarinimicrobiota bacterium]MBT4360115.1 hypothetical protein [Candidatus Neomarinimicrobiota bacterium]MBT4714036.1 hypothetical protein [Candidatus Neomarinimicrobiota bacterium]MBT4947864.1 hypothetical protein [Candidatus Neomarinimicrobiota bacterium]MBT5270269.1 hypothetical protein [Candidatus Neomarinimicrobiota bacterium]
MKRPKLISILARLFFLLFLAGTIQAEQPASSENSELASYAQDLYRQKGIDMARSAFDLQEKKSWGRIFVIQLVSRNTTLSDDLLQAFLVGGAVSQHARSPIDHVVVVADVEFSNRKAMILRADGACCAKLYNNRMTVDVFTRDCLRME